METRDGSSERRLIDAARRAAQCLTAAMGDLSLPSDSFPGYEIVRSVGRGGQGMVYEAVQQSTHRHVAIKAMREGPFTSQRDRTRFQREVEFIAQLQHPNIVSVLDSGIHKGLSFFVMEYVDGQPLDEADVPGQCDVRRTLSLVADICDVVDYAHQRGVLHRDLKPSNVLIDQRGQPHILDFGLAKAMTASDSSSIGMTISEPGQVLGTLGYMSPEQSRGSFQDLSVRSDVYSLGAMAYQLLTGALPCRVDGGLNEILERIAHQDPPQPSSIRRRLSADVDAILLKALEKTPKNRYSTAGELGADIRRFLADEPIVARRTGMATHMGRWVKRHRAVSAVSAAALVVIAVVTTTAVVRVRAQQRLAYAKAEQERLVSAFLAKTLGLFDPNKIKARDVTLKVLLDNAAGLVGNDLGSNPAAEAEVRFKLAGIYKTMKEVQSAERQFREALAIRERVLGEDNADVALTLKELGSVLRMIDPQKNNSEVEAINRRALAIYRRVTGEQSDEVAAMLNALGMVAEDRRQFDEALQLFTQSLEMRRRLFGEDHEKIGLVKNNIGLVKLNTKEFDEAVRWLREALPLYQKYYGQTEPLKVATCLNNLGEALRGRNDLDEAEKVCRQSLQIRRDYLGNDSLDLAGSLMVLGRISATKNDWPGAEATFRECLAICKAKAPPGHFRTPAAQSELGEALAKQGKYAEAEPLLIESYQSLLAGQGPGFRDTGAALERVVALYNAWGNAEKAAEYQAKLATK